MEIFFRNGSKYVKTVEPPEEAWDIGILPENVVKTATVYNRE